jgi:acetyl-CoA C-acetyltransferase
MNPTYVLSAVRTPMGTFGGSFSNHSPVDLAAPVMRAALEEAGVEASALDFYVMGNVLRGGHGQLVPRQAATQAGIPDSVDGMAVDMVCSSGMMSLLTAGSLMDSMGADLVLAGGTESMSSAGFALSGKARWGYKFGGEKVTDLMQRDGLSDPMSGEAMGEQAERLASEKDIAREKLDEIAVRSHRRAAEANEKGWFDDEIVPFEIETRSGTETLRHDEGIRADTSTEKLAGLSAAFAEGGVLTAGNSSPISDGASALLLASERAVEANGLEPVARLTEGAWNAGEPWRFPEAPIPAARDVAERTGRAVEDFDLYENNEAFALSSVLFHRMLGVPHDKLNVHGGALALGHPIGASGARITTTLIHALRRRGEEHGLASICHGTGGGTALAVERVA